MNRYRHSPPPGWLSILSAPRDGTVIEIQNNWGDRPWFGVFRWVAKRGWVDAADPMRGICSDHGGHLSWRPFAGSVDAYIAPADAEDNGRPVDPTTIFIVALAINVAFLCGAAIWHPVASCIAQ